MKAFILKFNQTEISVPVDINVITFAISNNRNGSSLNVGGLDKKFYKTWISENLKLGDEIEIKLAAVDNVSEPIEITINDHRLANYKQLKKMLTEEGII